MVILIGGASHTGKTRLAQELLEKYNYPYLSIDHLKMGLIRAGYTDLTPTDDDEKLTAYLWPVVREIVRTAVENGQNLTVEGCYIPYDWRKDFSEEDLSEVRYVCLVMTERYIRGHFEDIRAYAGVMERRGDDADCTAESLILDNARALEQCRRHRLERILIDTEYKVELKL